MSGDDTRCRCGDAGSCGCPDPAAAGRVPGDPPRFRHSAILGRMLDRITRAEAFGSRPLAGLGTRATDDPAIALLSAAAGTAHVLGWTLHRLYADGTLTATEDRAALTSLTGLLGHEPRPAISASTVLSFTLDDLPGAPSTVTIPKGTKVASIPDQGEKPQTFETDADIEARTAWNEIRPLRAPAPTKITTSTAEITVHGGDLNARVGDRVLVWAGESPGKVTWLLARVTAVNGSAAIDPAAPPPTVLGLAGQREITAPANRTTPAAQGTVILLGARARAFGAMAPDITFMPESVRQARGQKLPDPKPGEQPTGDGLPIEWKDLVLGPTDKKPWPVHLDAVHPEAAPGRAVVLETSGGTPGPTIGRIASAVETSRSDFGLSAPCTLVGIEIDKDTADSLNKLVRQTVIHLETARATLVVPPADPVLPLTDTSPQAAPQHPDLPPANQPDRLYVEGIAPLPPGRRVVVTGRDADDTTTVVEAATIASATTVTGKGSAGPATLLVFDAPLAGRWRSATLTILGNSVAATQGETPAMGAETLGSGNPATPLPHFVLKQKPLAHVPATGPTGYAPAIEVRVNDRTYERTDSLFGEGPDSRRFRVLARGDGGSDVQFAGRLPSGTGNVVALYRTGGGSAGNVADGRLTQLMTPVLGVRSVTNAARAEGGRDPETLDEIRTAAPKAIRSLDRAVSLTDYEAFAEGYCGVGKAAAVQLRSGMRRIICLTIATTTLSPPQPGSDLVKGLRDAILAAAPPGTHVRIAGFVDLPMSLQISLATDPAFRRGTVEAAVRTAVERDFGRAARRFGEAVHRSQVLATVQKVPGVVAALLTMFSAKGADEEATEDAEGRLPCPGPRLTEGVLEPARLLSVSAEAITFKELTP
ncbi:baseplate J/gp47 family protein [Micromonospora sp. SL4-19]|uniref:baseplate J/gp47 family protein n=1 Tax=Micromonospora sp. SL4-19 TaxID=3399129 RepID=UPI003A4D43B8